jgi:hypothetical protein
MTFPNKVLLVAALFDWKRLLWLATGQQCKIVDLSGADVLATVDAGKSLPHG